MTDVDKFFRVKELEKAYRALRARLDSIETRSRLFCQIPPWLDNYGRLRRSRQSKEFSAIIRAAHEVENDAREYVVTGVSRRDERFAEAIKRIVRM